MMESDIHQYSNDAFEKYNSNHMTIQSNPIFLTDPSDDLIITNDRPKPFLRRGAGLQRYSMSLDYHKKGPPDFYKKQKNKSSVTTAAHKTAFTRTKKPMISNKCGPSVRLKTQGTQPATVNSQPVKYVAERKYAMSAGKCFDDEIIPTARFGQRDGFGERILSLNTYELPIPKIPKTPIKKLVLKPITLSDNAHKNYDKKEDGYDDVNNSLKNNDGYDEKDDYDSDADDSVNKYADGQFMSPSANSVVTSLRNNCDIESANRCANSDNSSQQNIAKATTQAHNVHNDIDDPSDKCHQGRSAFEIAQFMKRKGLTDNVKKHLGWNASSLCIIRKKKIKKQKPDIKREKFTLHEIKEELRLLKEERDKLLHENIQMKRNEKDYVDKKLNLDKVRREMEQTLKSEKATFEENKLKFHEEQKKFKREKLAFDKYCQEARDLPTRDQRKVIENLKEEINSLKESKKTKDARIDAAQAQFRARIASLEMENNKLKKDLELAHKATLKKVRFESIGNFRSKVIDAVNDQLDANFSKRPNSFRGNRCEVEPTKPLIRRSKSAAELKSIPRFTGPHRETNANAAAASLNTDSVSNLNAKAELQEEEKYSSPEVEPIELPEDRFSDDADARKNNDCDSGVGSGQSSSRVGPDWSAFSKDINNYEATEAYPSIFDTHCCGGQFNKNADLHDSDDAPGKKFINEKYYGVEVNDKNINCSGCIPDMLVNQLPTNCYQNEDSFLPTLNISVESILSSREFTSTTAKVKGLVCIRHNAPSDAGFRKKCEDLLHSARLQKSSSNIIITQLASGDIEQEDIHRGQKLVLCLLCGTVETTNRSSPGYRRTTFPNGNTIIDYPDGRCERKKNTGERLVEFPNGEKELTLPNGDREITAKDYKMLCKRDGTVKFVYSDGRQETRYSGGRIRIKNKNGQLIMDTGGIGPRTRN